MSLNLDDIKLKTADELDDQEKDFLVDHKADLNEEDLEAYAPIFNPQEESEPAPDEPEPVPEPVPNTNPEPEQTFKTEDDIKRYIQEETAKLKAELGPEKEPEPEPEPQPYFKEGELPKDWNDAATKIAERTREETIKELEQRRAEEVKKAEESQKQIQAIKAQFDDQFSKLAESGRIPDLATDEGKSVQREIYTFGAKNGHATPFEAYTAWSLTPKDKGGGYDPASPEVKKQQMQQQKRAASLVGGGDSPGGSDDADANKLTWEQLHNTDLDNIDQL